MKITEFIKKRYKIVLPAAIAVILAVAVLLTVLFIKAPSASPVGGSSVPDSGAASSQNASSDTSSDAGSSLPDGSEEDRPTLALTCPEAPDITVNDPVYTFKGTAAPGTPLLLNGEEIALDGTGNFAAEVTLKEGENIFNISQGDTSYTYVINYKKLIIKEIYPASAVTVESAATLVVSCVAPQDSTVTATWNGSSVTLYKSDTDEAVTSGYVTYMGGFDTPFNTGSAKSYGAVSFKAVSPAGTESRTGGKVTVKTYDKSKYDGGNGYASGSDYLNVGTTLVAEIVTDSAETFDADDATDLSRPTNNYLPKGTVDYCSPFTKTFRSSGTDVELITMRYGKQVYRTTSRDVTNAVVYEGALPETNRVSVSSFGVSGRHTLLTLDVAWKAPFRFEYLPQSYKNTSDGGRNYIMDAVTFTHIDITFCYAESFDGELDLTDSPLFSSCEIIPGEYDCTLRLYLKEAGGFYGWSAEYNSSGQLEFYFLDPVELKEADNEYGYSLEGVTVVVDAGHGGSDPGALGFESAYHEATLNLYMAKELRSQLETLGATVIMTRTDSGHVSAEDRIAAVTESRPDFVISIHRNSFYRSDISGFEPYFFTPFSFKAAESIYGATMDTGIYKQTANSRVKWSVFFLSRLTQCPAVLTENGYISSTYDYNNMKDAETNKKLASALIKGMIDYFIY